MHACKYVILYAMYPYLGLYAEAAEPGGHWGHVPPPPPHFSPQSMKCPTSTGVHARPTMYQEGVPIGAIIFFLYVRCPLTPVPPPPTPEHVPRRLCLYVCYVGPIRGVYT